MSKRMQFGGSEKHLLPSLRYATVGTRKAFDCEISGFLKMGQRDMYARF